MPAISRYHDAGVSKEVGPQQKLGPFGISGYSAIEPYLLVWPRGFWP